MAPCVIIPTFWTRRRGAVHRTGSSTSTTTPRPSTRTARCRRCLRSLEERRRASARSSCSSRRPTRRSSTRPRTGSATSSTTSPDSTRSCSARPSSGSLHRRLEQLEFADMIAGVSLTGYGAVRNVGLIVAAVARLRRRSSSSTTTRSSTTRTSSSRAIEGLGAALARRRADPREDRLLRRRRRAATRCTTTRTGPTCSGARPTRTTEALAIVDAPPRLKPSQRSRSAAAWRCTATCSRTCRSTRGSCAARTSTTSSTPACTAATCSWTASGASSTTRPSAPSEAIALRQDVYRFIYEHRKLEFAKSQVDLRQVTADVAEAVSRATSSASSVDVAGVRDRGAARARRQGGAATYLDGRPRGALATRPSTRASNCDNYFAFQRRWPMLMDRIWEDVALEPLFTRRAQRRPHAPSPAASRSSRAE